MEESFESAEPIAPVAGEARFISPPAPDDDLHGYDSLSCLRDNLDITRQHTPAAAECSSSSKQQPTRAAFQLPLYCSIVNTGIMTVCVESMDSQTDSSTQADSSKSAGMTSNKAASLAQGTSTTL